MQSDVNITEFTKVPEESQFLNLPVQEGSDTLLIPAWFLKSQKHARRLVGGRVEDPGRRKK